MRESRVLQSFPYSMQYTLYGLAVLLSLAVAAYIYLYLHKISGSLNLALVPFFAGIFFWGYFTGRPCLKIYPDSFEYRRFPVGRSKIVLLEDIVKVDIRGTEILIYCAALGEPIRIKSASFAKRQLPAITAYFKSLGQA